MEIGLGLYLLAGSMLLVIIEAFASYYLSNNFLPSQVLARWKKPGIAFLAHGGMWGDLFLLPPLMAWVIARHSSSWDVDDMLIIGSIGFLITLGNHILLITTQAVPDPLGWQQEKCSITIALHFVYMTLYVALVGLFYFSPNVGVRETVIVSVILGIHTTLGTHIVLGIVDRWMKWSWCPDFLASPILPYMTVGIWIILAVFAWFAAGWQAGVSVTMIAVGMEALILYIIQISPAYELHK